MWNVGNGGEINMATTVDRVCSEVERLVRPRKVIPDELIPDVDPNSPDLDDLFAWGRAIARHGGITRERSREILAAVRRHAKTGR